MKGKRALRPDGSPDVKPAREAKRVKHSTDASATLVVSPRLRSEKAPVSAQSKTPSKKSKTQPKSIAGEYSLAPKTADEQQLRRSNSWGLSCRSGGRLLNLDPVFSSDEKYIILSRDNAVKIYSMTTSSIVRTLQIPDNLENITGYKLSPVNPDHLFVATRSGNIVEWDWTTGNWICSWDISKPILAIDVIPITTDDSETVDTPAIYTICKGEDGQYEICMSIRDSDSGGNSWKQSVIYKTSIHLNNLGVAAGGQVILATAGAFIVVGHTNRLAGQSQKPVERTWREVRLPVYTTCFDIREVSRPNEPSATAKRQHSQAPVVDLAIGESEGAILVYHDIVNTILRCEVNSELDAGLVSRRLHWHRNMVKTVRWSQDGNYLISGGLETVLVLWQLDTGRKQFLPHLTSPICNLVVSPSGVSYAVKLADNSAMVLSTSELRPTASISSLQVPSYDDLLESKRHLKTKKLKGSTSTNNRGPSFHRLAATLHPIQSDQLLLAVPSSQTISSPDELPSASFLQTFDTRSNQHISRQALARTNVSVLNTGPEGTELTTPDIKFVQTSFDGDWLVTVDEWEQYSESMSVLTPFNEPSEQPKRKEIYLKFWHWNQNNSEWELVTRIDGPHFSSSGGSMPIRDLAVSPKDLTFATVGDDGVIRLWSPEFRHNNSKKQPEKRTVRTWRCSRSIALEKPPTDGRLASQTGSCLSFSEDGSALAVCWTGQSTSGTGVVSIIDPHSGRICHTREGLYVGIPRGCGFLDRYLIILSDYLISWHTVTDEIVFALTLADKRSTHSLDRALPLLALNHRNQTFAITSPSEANPVEAKASDARHKPSFQVSVFEPTGPEPLFQSELKHSPRALLANTKSGDYIIVDSAAEVLQVSSSSQMARAPIEASEIDLPVRTGLEDMFGSSHRLLAQQAQPELDRGDVEREGQAKSLADIFDVGPSFALPSVDVLLQDVVDIFASKPVEA